MYNCKSCKITQAKLDNLNKKLSMSDGSFVVDDYTKREAQAFLAGARYGIKLANDTISITQMPKCKITSTDNTFYYVELDSYFPKPIFKNWWNAPYKKEVEK